MDLRLKFFSPSGFVFLLGILTLFSCSDKKKSSVDSLEELMINSAELRIEKVRPELEALKVKFRNFAAPRQGDWAENHSVTPQFVDAYKKSSPNKVDSKRQKIYIWQLGEFTDEQLKILDETILYMEACFGVPVVKLSKYSLNKIPLEARRRSRETMVEQLNAKYILNSILLPNRPDDALALIAFTGKDLYPSKSWNFVFGLASLTKRIGVWSMYRNGDPTLSQAHYMQ